MSNLHYSAFHWLCLVAATIATHGECLQLRLNELTAQGRDAVDEHVPVKMIELMLHDTGQIALHPFVMLLEILVHPLHMNARGTDYLLVNGRQ